MVKALRFSLLLAVLGAASLIAQTDSDHPLAELAVSRLNLRFTLSGSLLGLGSGGSLAGRSVVWPQADASALSWNPAALALLEKRSLVVDWVPGLTQDLSQLESLYDIDQEVRDQMDEAVADYGTDQSTVGYPDLEPVSGMRSSVAGFGLGVPFRLGGVPMGVGFGYAAPLLLNLDLQGTGIDALIDSEQEIEGSTRRIRMRTQASLTGAAEVAVNQLLLGWGAQPLPGLSVGVTASRYRVRARGRARANIDGIIEMSGNEYAFNDPNDPAIDFAAGETNALDQVLASEFSGSGWGYKIGVVQRIARGFQLGVTVELPQSITLEGYWSSVTHEIPFLNFEDGDDVDEMIDPTAINLAQLTLTQRREKRETHRLIIELPKAYNVGLALGGGGFSLVLRGTLYRGDLAYDLVGEERRGLKFKYGGGVTLDFRYFFIGASVALVDEIKPVGDVAVPTLDIPWSNVNLGFRIPTPLHVWVDGIVAAEPTPSLRLSFRHDF